MGNRMVAGNSNPDKVLAGPSFMEGEVVRVVARSGKAVTESFVNGSWVVGGDPVSAVNGRPLSDKEAAALPKSSSR